MKEVIQFWREHWFVCSLTVVAALLCEVLAIYLILFIF